MLHSILYDPQGFILVKLHGPLILSEVRQVMAAVAQLAREHQCFRLLTDTLRMQLKLSLTDVYYLPGMFAELLSAFGLQAQKFKRAVIVSPDDQVLQFFETLATNRGQNVKLFYNEESAKQWLMDT